MSCIERTQLEAFLKGKLTPERMLAVDEHVSGCADCKAALMKMAAPVAFAAEVSGAVDCPEYEELSAYVEQSLDAQRTGWIRNHVNMCELCARDIGRIEELRSHAAMREKIVVRPGMGRQSQRRSVFVYWKQAFAGLSAAGLIAVAAMFGNLGGSTVANKPTQVASNPTINHQPRVAPPSSNQQPKPNAPQAVPPAANSATPATNVAANPTAAPVTKTILRDGRYALVASSGRMDLAKKNGVSVRTALEAKIAAKLDEKLRTGRIKPVKPVQMAMASIHMRAEGNGYQAPPTAPKQISPMGKVMLSDRPMLSWSAVDLAESYRIRIYNASGNLVVDQIVTRNSAALTKPLARGQVYTWRVGVRFGETDQWAESAAAKFAVLSSEDYASIKRVQKKLPGSHLALGVAYESAGLYEQAAGEYRALRRANPNSKLAQKMLYGVAGR